MLQRIGLSYANKLGRLAVPCGRSGDETQRSRLFAMLAAARVRLGSVGGWPADGGVRDCGGGGGIPRRVVAAEA